MKSIAVVILSLLPLCACGASQTGGQLNTAAPSPPPAAAAPTKPGGMMRHGKMAHGMADKCPMAVQGTVVSSEEVEGGATMTFKTTGDVAELRRRIAKMAKMHEQHASEGCPMMKTQDHSPGAPAAHDHGG